MRKGILREPEEVEQERRSAPRQQQEAACKRKAYVATKVEQVLDTRHGFAIVFIGF